MSNLNSVFDTRRGYPFGSALEAGFEPASGVTFTEGNVVTVQAGRQLTNALVLRMVSDATGGGSPPTLLAADKGKAYVVNTWGVGYNDGDILEWDGTDFQMIAANDGGACVDGARVVVDATGAAGSFAGQANKVMVYTQDPSPPPLGAWTVADSPATGNRIRIKEGVYNEKFYDYNGTIWVKATKQAPAPSFVNLMTSGTQATAQKDDAWIVIQGNDQWDASFVNQVTCLKLRSGCTVKVPHASADTLVPGTVVQANAGVLEAYSTKWPVGIVIRSNGVSGSGGQIVIASY